MSASTVPFNPTDAGPLCATCLDCGAIYIPADGHNCRSGWGWFDWATNAESLVHEAIWMKHEDKAHLKQRRLAAIEEAMEFLGKAKEKL